MPLARIHTLQINEAGGLKKLIFNYGYARKLYFLSRGFNQDKVGGRN
jgi:hypothetical protein